MSDEQMKRYYTTHPLPVSGILQPSGPLQLHPEDVLVPVNRDILDRLRAYLTSIGDTETTYSAIIANWIDVQKIADMQESDR
jgi:hypothetical protein